MNNADDVNYTNKFDATCCFPFLGLFETFMAFDRGVTRWRLLKDRSFVEYYSSL